MNNSLPSMPSVSPSFPSSGEAQVSQAPFTEALTEQSVGADVDLNVPSHLEQDLDPVGPPPAIQVSLPGPVNEVKAPVAAQRGIKVVATRKGFYNQMRYREGEQFVIRSEEDFGEWMKCVDPSFEKKRQEFYKQKRLKAKV